MNYRKKAILMVVALFCLNIAMLAQAVSLKKMNNVSVKEAMTQLKNKKADIPSYIKWEIWIQRKL